MNFRIRSDLAVENCGETEDELRGIERIRIPTDVCEIDRIEVKTEEAAKRIGKPMGAYVTLRISSQAQQLPQDGERCARLLSGELARLSNRFGVEPCDRRSAILAVGLGNRDLTADALGPLTVERITATRHLRQMDPGLFHLIECSSLALVAPGVLGKTGIEASDLVSSVVERIRPDLVIAVDSLAAGDVERLGTTVQISSTGIVPGSGVGNRRGELTHASLGVPVIAVGVPTVVDSATLILDSLSKAGLEEPPAALKTMLARSEAFFVSPKEIDHAVQWFSNLIARGIEMTFAGDLI